MHKSIVTGSFDDLRSSDVRFLEEAAKLGELHVFLWSDEVVRRLDGTAPKFSLGERTYLLQAIRYVHQVQLVDQLTDRHSLPPYAECAGAAWVVDESNDSSQKRAFCASYGMSYQVVKKEVVKSFPEDPNHALLEDPSDHKKVVVTGCYDWFHSGHVRFFEEVSELGDLYVVAGSDENVRLLKGDGHPMYPQEERRYVVQSIRFVRQALISSGNGWMDAEPEIAWIKPDIYAVNEDGDQPEKRSFCEAHGIQYVVLKRIPKEGLPKRQSVDLRGF
ncbi:MAG: adenylyltransferase/cytidyltransferase family protein [Anaerolineales bacterium]